MKKLIALAMGTLLLAGCGPHRLSPAEQAAQKAKAERIASAKRKQVAAAQLRAEQAKVAADARRQREQADAAEAKRIAANQKQLHLLPLPADVHQIGDARFVADGGGIASLRHICSGDNNNVSDASVQSDGSVLVKCREGVHDFRDETWNNTYTYDKEHGVGMLGVMTGK